MKKSKLFAALPDYVSTPDGMAIDPEGNLILACPNYADQTKPGCILKIDKDKNIRKWFDVPCRADTGLASPMGIAFGPDGDLYICDNQGWPGRPELLEKGRILRVRMQGDEIVKTTVVADGMEHPNGMRIRDGFIYVTQSSLPKVKHPSGKLVSCVYRFRLEDENVLVTNTLEDKNMLVTFVTENPDDQYGADGIEFDREGNLLVGNFGDGAVYKVTFNEDLSVKSCGVWAQDRENLESTDGMIMDGDGNLYIADFCVNAIVKILPDGTVTKLAQNGDTDGLNGELDQPGEPIIWNGKLIVSCFDTVCGGITVNSKHDPVATLAEIEL
ncbi:MAG: SMP-30/gluconolactonase/LRE family protein [Clostridia bacterium]|nr:SMP-30/gluconolactonase/LRE family protein [Clostridia bacterium]